MLGWGVVMVRVGGGECGGEVWVWVQLPLATVCVDRDVVCGFIHDDWVSRVGGSCFVRR